MKPHGVILAGGQARRMGMEQKALLPLAKATLIHQVISKVNPQVCDLYLSVDRVRDAYGQLGLRQVEDGGAEYRGPLAGLYAVMKHIETQRAWGDSPWLFVSPCDAPLLPPGLADLLLDAAGDAQAAVVSYQGTLQCTSSIWQRSVLTELEHAVVEQGRGGFKQLLPVIDYRLLEWPEEDFPPFFNVNHPEDYEIIKNILNKDI